MVTAIFELTRLDFVFFFLTLTYMYNFISFFQSTCLFKTNVFIYATRLHIDYFTIRQAKPVDNGEFIEQKLVRVWVYGLNNSFIPV